MLGRAGALGQLPIEKLLARSGGNDAVGAGSGAVLGGEIAYAAGGDVLQGATQAAIGGALGGFTRGFYLNRFAQVCFVAGGPLVMNFDGNSTPTEEIQVGEFVLARSEFDPASPLELKRVEEKLVRTSVVMELVVRRRSIRTTVEHPFYAPAQNDFVPAEHAKAGDHLIAHDGGERSGYGTAVFCTGVRYPAAWPMQQASICEAGTD